MGKSKFAPAMKRLKTGAISNQISLSRLDTVTTPPTKYSQYDEEEEIYLKEESKIKA